MQKRERHTGFVLVVTLMVVAVMAGALTAIGTRVRLATRMGITREAQAQSRRTALAALDLALAHLQRVSGPDQRFSACADITSESPVKQPSWTGVWNRSEGGTALTSWLVSGNHGIDPLAVTLAAAPDPSNPPADHEVLLVDRGTVSRLDQRIKIAKVPITLPRVLTAGSSGEGETTVGHFAYWIGDEGIKASMVAGAGSVPLDYDNTMPPADAALGIAAGSDWHLDADARMRLLQMRLSGPRSDLLFLGFEPDALVMRMARVVSRTQLPMLSEQLTRSQARAHFHAITDCARAVAVDHYGVNARLRRDLSDTPDVEDVALRQMLLNRPRHSTGPGDARHAIAGACDPAFSVNAVGFSTGPVLTECVIRLHFYRNAVDESLWMIREVQAELWNPNSSSISPGENGLDLDISGWPEVEVTYGAHRVKVDLAMHLGRFPVDRNTLWQPGEIAVLKGHGILGQAGLGGAIRVSAIGALPHEPGVDRLGVRWPAMTAAASMRYAIMADGVPIARYEPEIPYEAADLMVSPAEALLPASLGFGFALRNDLSFWMDGAREDARDPRSCTVRGAMIEPATGGTSWSTRPDENTADILLGGDGVFNSHHRYCCAELPRQEIVSVAELQHLVTARPHGVGNPWGGSANALFDRYFLSTIPRWAAFDPSAPVSLPNPFIELRAPSAAPIPPGRRDEAAGHESRFLLDRDHAASFLLIRGSFNVNSTSAEAWKTVLAGVSLPEWTYGSAASTSLLNAHFRFAHTAGHFAADPYSAPSASDAYLRGVRMLAPGQVDVMAESMVRSLSRRGAPFGSLAEFINSGFLERAIADAGINAGLPAALARSPAWLTQADVLGSIAPFIVPRSDTFLLRCYGDVQNPTTGAIEARAWCEAIVQRVPSLTAPAAGVTGEPDDVLEADPAKYPRGRKFIVIRFRWLGPADI